MPDRIPLRMMYYYKYSLGNAPESVFPFEVRVDGNSAAHGEAFFVLGPKGAEGEYGAISLLDPAVAKGAFWIGGEKSTEPTDLPKGTVKVGEKGGGGNAGQLSVAVYDKDGHRVKQTDGFSVASIPLNVTQSIQAPLVNAMRVGQLQLKEPIVGMLVKVAWESDSGHLEDLGAVYWSEEVQVTTATGVFAGQIPNVTGYGPSPASVGRASDVNAFPTALVAAAMKQGKASSVEANQVFIFHDYRTGAMDIPFPNSGFLMTYQIKLASGGKLDSVVFLKQGKDVTANGFSSKAGTTDPKEGLEFKAT